LPISNIKSEIPYTSIILDTSTYYIIYDIGESIDKM
jgi:hypothetical protein